MKKILVVEDDKALVRGLTLSLKRENFDVHSAGDGIAGYELAKEQNFDLVILDIIMPGMNGLEVCQKLRSGHAQMPILMLTSRKEEVDKVLGLELGADDYLTKPFGTRELVARVRALLRRGSTAPPEIDECSFDDVYVDFRKQEANKGKKSLAMTAKEYELLRYFVRREGEVVSRAQLLDDVWGYDVTPTTRTVDNYILSLRKKIEAHPSKPTHLLTIHTAGYKFVR